MRTVLVLAMVALAAPEVMAAAGGGWQALVETNGAVQLRCGGQAFGTLEPGLFEATWRGASLGPGKLGQAPADGLCRGQIRAPGGTVVETQTRFTPVEGGIRLQYKLTPQADIHLNSLHVTLGIPERLLAGGQYTADGAKGAFPVQRGDTHVYSKPTRSLEITTPAGQSLRFAFAQETPVLLQDDRQWGPTFSVRIGPQMAEDAAWPAGKAWELELTLTAQGGMKMEQDGPVTIEPGAEWLPLDTQLDIEPGSALDFSKLTPWHAPAGRLGRVLAGRGGHFVFASQPNVPARFYGVNFCFTAQYISHEQADRLAARLRRLGYNAVRIHHYESTLVDRSGGTSTRFNPQALDQLDYFFAALKKQGIYVTTDLFVSRPVFAREIWEGAPGDIPMDDYKMAVQVNDRAFENYAAFIKAFLGHVNPYTKLRYADDPALAFLSLVNEGTTGNFLSRLNGPLKEDFVAAWKRWLAARKPGEISLPAGAPFPQKIDNSPEGTACAVFLADTERAFVARARKLIRDELGCKALLTNMNAWTNPVQYESVRPDYDYVDDHFYVDHPQFLEQPWRLPSRCPNSSPVAEGAPGGRSGAFVRLLDKPFTITEFNYSGPGRFRGVGGILTGALGAVQDWSGIWRFAYSHSRDNLFSPGAAGYFDVATDPLSQAADRASLCLFLRGDLSPSTHSVALAATPDEALKNPKGTPGVSPSWNGLAWVVRTGYCLLPKPAGTGADVTLPLGWSTPAGAWGKGALALNPYAPDAGEKLLAELRRRGWVSRANRTDLRGPRFESDNGQITIDGPADVLTLNTARTAGGYAPAGKTIKAQAVTVAIEDTDATVWVSSLDGAPITDSRRLLITHLTDLQNNGVKYADRDRRTLLSWGGLPHLVRAGRATVTIRMKDAAKAKVYGLTTAGKRTAPVPATAKNGTLTIPLDVNDAGKARMMYEVVAG